MRRTPPLRSGFTLIELMVVIAIVGGVLLLVPTNLDSFGARSRLENAGNTLVAVAAASRSQAITDGFPVTLQVGRFEDDGGVERFGYRWIVTNMPAERSEMLVPEDAVMEEERKPEEREWIETNWNRLSRGVEISGVSEEKDNWKPLREDRPYGVVFGPDGSVEKAFAIRLRAPELETKDENRTVTVVVNGLTAEASAYDGYKEVPPLRDESDFGK